jgi:hypothetical protein
MAAVLLALVVIAGPVLVVGWSVIVVRRWAGAWRWAAAVPIAMAAGDGRLYVAGSARDPMGHSGWWLGIAAVNVTSLALAFLLSEVRARRSGTHGHPSAPPNVRRT